VNQLLQGKPKKSANDLTRFLINSTVGLGGFIDVASTMGLERHEEDFGQTLAVWGVGEGPYIMLPGLGPSTLRDTFSKPVSSFLSVTFHMTETDVNIALKSIDAIETRERLLDVESLLSGDKYAFVKDAYIQSIKYEVKDGIDVQDDFVDDMDDFLID
jgi:phospholipid-binding lipoprotein MlaA